MEGLGGGVSTEGSSIEVAISFRTRRASEENYITRPHRNRKDFDHLSGSQQPFVDPIGRCHRV
jgi:hypothetical protein